MVGIWLWGILGQVNKMTLSPCMLLQLHHETLIMKHTPPPYCLFLLARCTKNPGGSTDSDSMSPASHVSVKQSMFQSLMFLWKATLVLILSTLLSRHWTLASNILGSGGWCARLRSLTRRPLHLPLLWWRCFGSVSGISSNVLGGSDKGSASGKLYS
jgi:hypothetical protein